MIEEELSKIWKSSPQEEQIKFDKSRFLLDVQSNIDDFYQQMKGLFLRESLGVIIAVPLIVYFAFTTTVLLTKVAFLLLALWIVYIMYLLRRIKHTVPDQFSMSYLEYLKETKKYLEESKRYRETVILWFILPPGFLMWLGLFGSNFTDPDNLKPQLIAGAIFLLIGTIVYWTNSRSAKKYVGPKLEKVNGLIKTLEE
ncbi:MAG: hypothetical protein AAF990_24120 [Bacteroidota bacterium]